MKRTVKLLCLAAMLIGIGTAAQAQFRQSVYLNGTIPTGDLASDIEMDVEMVPLTITNIGKDASAGFGLGYRASYRFDVGMGMVAPFLNADFLWNPIASKWRDKYSDMNYGKTTYINLPVQLGVSYIYDELPWPDISAYGEFGLGTDLLWITSEGTGSGNEKYAYKMDFAFAWSLGVGAYFGRHVSAGLHYYGLGKHNIDYTKGTIEDNDNAAIQNAEMRQLNKRERRTAGALMLRIGFHF